MPLRLGNTWNYSVRSGMQGRVDHLKVTKELSVTGTKGWQLEGPMGISRVAWKNSVLHVDQVPGIRFSPPIPLLDTKATKATRDWNGFITHKGKHQECAATIQQEADKYALGTRQYNTIKVVALFKLPSRKIELTTWFVDQIGILGQQQRTNHYLDYGIEYISGP